MREWLVYTVYKHQQWTRAQSNIHFLPFSNHLSYTLRRGTALGNFAQSLCARGEEVTFSVLVF